MPLRPANLHSGAGVVHGDNLNNGARDGGVDHLAIADIEAHVVPLTVILVVPEEQVSRLSLIQIGCQWTGGNSSGPVTLVIRSTATGGGKAILGKSPNHES